jgi:hypothetical protein
MHRFNARAVPALLGFLICWGASAGQLAHATRWVSAFDPNLHVKPPTMKGVDGVSRALVIDGDFSAAAARFRKANPGLVRAEGGIAQSGEVVIVEGSEETLETTAQGSAPRLQAIARKVIAKFGDKFQAMTLWLTFNDTASTQAAAYEFTVKADVRGLGMTLRDMSSAMGSSGVLRSMLNMKTVWNDVNVDDDYELWRPILETWGQESGHRWMVFMRFVDRRTGRLSDALLGRDCSHYHRLVDTQSSVHDGLSWTDNRDGSFTANRRDNGRYGVLDLYGMGLVAADEVPPFFFIDGVAGYTRPGCDDYARVPPPGRAVVSGTRVDVSVYDVIAAEGPRVPSADENMGNERQDYFREVQVIVTSAKETAESPIPVMLAARLNKARLLWERWMSEATGKRMVVCTRVTGDCGDPRSDVMKVTVNPERRSPAAGLTTVEAVVSNTGAAPASGIEAHLTASVPGGEVSSVAPVGALMPGESRTVPFAVDLRAQPCGTAISLKVATQSDHHRHRMRQTILAGTESLISDGFEADSAWVINPDMTDTAQGAVWERAKPEWTEIQPGKVAQPEGAHAGVAAFVTGGAAANAGRETFLHNGRSTLESPAFDSAPWRDPHLRYWVSFSGMEATAGGDVVPSARARLLVLARLANGADAGITTSADGGAPGAWIEIDRLENLIQPAWTERIVKLPAGLVGGRVVLRFVAEDSNDRMGGVEAAVDDVEILSHLPACYEAPPRQDDGGGCGLAPGQRSSRGWGGSAAALLVVGLALMAVRSRRQQPK